MGDLITDLRGLYPLNGVLQDLLYMRIVEGVAIFMTGLEVEYLTGST